MQMKGLKITMLALLLTLALAPSVIAQSAAGEKSHIQMGVLGTTSLTDPVAGAVDLNNLFIRSNFEVDLLQARLLSTTGLSPTTPLPFPSPAGSPVVGAGPGFMGFNGLNMLDQALVSGFAVEPPDQGLCVGNGFILEAVNLAFVVYDQNGTKLKGPTFMNTFFKLDRFQFTSDPRCLYDRQTRRWFATTLQIDVRSAPAPHILTGKSHLIIAVSQTDDPRLGWNVFSIDTTDDGTGGTQTHPRCPCYGDEPLIGADRHGFYVTTNEFPLFTGGFNGAQIYAMSKKHLAQGFLPTVVHFGGLPLAEGIAYSVQPATSPGREEEREDRGEDSGGGVEYFMSTLDFRGPLDNRIAVWAITDTDSLKEFRPDVELSKTIVTSEAYGVPPDAIQKPGPPSSTPFKNAFAPLQPLEMLSTGDDRMQAVVFTDGKLWGSLSTVVRDGTGFHSGIAYFVVKPSVDEDQVHARMKNQGYISVPGNDVFYPAIGLNREGEGAIVFTLGGPGYFPSAAYVRVDDDHGVGKVHIAAAGAGPDDSFSGYNTIFFGGGPSGRWGDYSAAAVDGEGNIWIATEYISGGPRLLFGNWATFIGRVKTEED